MIATAIGAGISLASAIGGAISSAYQNNQASKLLQQQKDDNKSWYEMQMNRDYTERSDAQSILTKQKELLQNQYKYALGTQAVAGGSDEAMAQLQNNANQTVGDTMSDIAAGASAHKDQVEQQYKAKDDALTQQQIAIKQNQAAQIAQAASQGVNAGTGLIGADINNPNTVAPVTSPAVKLPKATFPKTINTNIIG